MSGAGLKKCMPTTRSGDEVAAAISVTESAEVFVARMQSGRTIRSSSANRAVFAGRSSTIASITRSQSANASRSVVSSSRADSRVPVFAAELALVDLASEEVRDAARGRLTQLRRHLATDRLVAALDRELRDAGTHGAEPDHADLSDVTSRHDARS